LCISSGGDSTSRKTKVVIFSGSSTVNYIPVRIEDSQIACGGCPGRVLNLCPIALIVRHGHARGYLDAGRVDRARESNVGCGGRIVLLSLGACVVTVMPAGMADVPLSSVPAAA